MTIDCHWQRIGTALAIGCQHRAMISSTITITLTLITLILIDPHPHLPTHPLLQSVAKTDRSVRW